MSESSEVIVVNMRGFELRVRDARDLTKATGRTLTELLGGSDLADQLQTFAFIELRRRDRRAGRSVRDPVEVWAEAEDCDVRLDSGAAGVAMPDPLGATSY